MNKIDVLSILTLLLSRGRLANLSQRIYHEPFSAQKVYTWTVNLIGYSVDRVGIKWNSGPLVAPISLFEEQLHNCWTFFKNCGTVP